jgi:EmrB/QacA subfamily drug resistance transporter
VEEPRPVTAGERRLTLASVMIVFLLSAISQTVVATAMPRIVADLDGLPLYAWVQTAYLLTSTVMVPIWGKLGDLYGRKPVLLSSIAIFLAGSWLAGLAGEFGTLPLLGGGMTQLIWFRAIQGIGGGGLFTVAFAIIADLYAPRERAQFAGLFGATFGIANVGGPVIGGFLTDHGTVTILGQMVEGWRWVFYANAPVSLLALFMILTQMPGLRHSGTGGKIDYPGAALVIVAAVSLLLAMTWGGRNYPWASWQILGLLALFAASSIALIRVEQAVRDPIVPLDLFKDRVFSTSNAANVITGAAFMGVTSFMPLFMQVGQGVPATRSGLTMLAVAAGITASSTINGRLVTMAGVYKPFLVAGAVILVGGVFSMCFIGPETSTLDLAWRLFLVGVGLGPTQSMFSLAIQNAVPADKLGVATASSQFFRALGNTLGVALFGAMLIANLSTELDRRAPSDARGQHVQMADLQRMAMTNNDHLLSGQPPPPETPLQRAVKASFSAATVAGLWVSLGLVIVGLLVILAIPGRPLKEHHGPAPPQARREEEPEAAG